MKKMICSEKQWFCVLFYFYILLSDSDAQSNHFNVMKVTSKLSNSDKNKKNLRSTYNDTEKELAGNFDSYDFLSPFSIYSETSVFSKHNTSQCQKDILRTIDAINKNERWALQMLDASARFPIGLLHGNIYQLGNFDECISRKTAHIQGQYCLIDVNLNSEDRFYNKKISKNRHKFDDTIHWGLCVPSSCTPEDVAYISETLLRQRTELKSATVNVNSDKCHVDKSLPLTIPEIIFGLVIGTFLAFTGLATGYHFLLIQKKDAKESNFNKYREAFLCFSVIGNAEKFLTTKKSSSDLGCIDGMRFLSTLFIVFSHAFLFTLGGPVQNTGFYEKESRSFLNTIFVNSPLLVDTFLLISGFLISYSILTELNKNNGTMNIYRLYVARFLRLTPVYIAIIGFYSTLMFRLGDGPLWDSRIKEEQERCIESWWTNILYVNNYVKTDNICMFQVWQLSVDFQLYLVAPFFVYLLWRWDKLGKCIISLVIAVTVITPCIITYVDDLDPTLMVYGPEIYDLSVNYYYKVAYIKTHMRAGPYFIGILVAYILHKMKTQKAKIPKYLLAFGWILATIFAPLAMTSVIVFYQPNYVYNGLDAAIYYFFHKVAWCASIGWIIITCATGNALYVNDSLSWKIFTPLSKLSYSAFLIDGFVELYSLGSLRKESYVSKFELVNRSFAHIVLVFGSAVFVTVLLESPIREAEKVFLRKAKRNETSTI